jgi:chromosome segregation ATPase
MIRTPSSSSFLVAVLLALFTSSFSLVNAFAPHLGPVVARSQASPSVVLRYANNNNNNNNKNNDVEYVFISMEEAEEALRQERMQFDRERQQMRGLLEDQRRQLEELAARQGQRAARSKRKGPSATTIVPPDVIDVTTESKSTTVVSSSSSSSSLSSNTAPHEQAMQWADTEGGLMQQEQYQEQLRNIEHQLRHVMGENERLMKRLQDQHRNFQGEKRELQERIMEERERLTHLREELNMERAYFDTSRKLLENLLETEQKKVMALQEELFSRDIMGRQFAHGSGPDAARIHEEFATFSNGNHPRRNGKAGRHSGMEGLEMNMNDIRSPLYP